jgi:hypothetical protein
MAYFSLTYYNDFMSRRVFFSFHYADVASFRANVVRNCGAISKENSEFYDASLWEDAKTKGEPALRKLIDDGLHNTSVTAVLIGEHTASRDWVRYEIAKSFARDNGLIGIYIDGYKDKFERYGVRGVNPFDYLHYSLNRVLSRVELSEWRNGQWISYAPLPHFPTTGNGRRLNESGQLSTLITNYVWNTSSSPAQLSTWVEKAAREVGR